MRQAVKLLVVSALFIFAAALLFSGCQSGAKSASSATTAKAAIPAPTDAPASGGKTIQKAFQLGMDSQDEHGEVDFDHDSHAYKQYSPDGKSTIACTECHHTNQPKSALKPPDKTSTADAPLTLAAFQGGQAVQNCRTCHFQDGNVPDGKEMPQATYTTDGTSVTKDLNNQLAYHINCNTCHDAALAARPELKSKAGFAGSKDCMVCHKKS